MGKFRRARVRILSKLMTPEQLAVRQGYSMFRAEQHGQCQSSDVVAPRLVVEHSNEQASQQLEPERIIREFDEGRFSNETIAAEERSGRSRSKDDLVLLMALDFVLRDASVRERRQQSYVIKALTGEDVDLLAAENYLEKTIRLQNFDACTREQGQFCCRHISQLLEVRERKMATTMTAVMLKNLW
ncbi:unnamed protein product [Gongylonema pulchrum]|uniref:Uncharacterized protein n=1 Tax=Gongylonema pulchrum TaxID=637853 RepID=A0A183DU21_9BILA|nr:unnamed protein product [Gongylonema pulchrum]